MRAYLCGPMTGIQDFNFPAFHEATNTLRAQDWDIVNPAELDELEGFDSTTAVVSQEAYYDVLGRDLRQLMSVEAIIALPGWERSRGAKAEIALARALSKQIFFYKDGIATPEDRAVGSLLFDDTTYTQVDPVTGGSKGGKVTRFDLIPVGAISEVAAVYGKGEIKYPSGPEGPNWMKGMPWSWNVAAMFRHLYKWLSGQKYDEEDGIHHLAHVAWHCFTLMTFEQKGLGTDDRRA